jgi:glucokinase
MSNSIGIDIGGTKIAVGAVDKGGNIVARTVLATEAALGFERALDRIGEAIDNLIAQVGWHRAELAGIGIGCAGPVDPKRGLINNPYTLGGWDRCDIVSPLRARFGTSVYLENDADAAVIGECWRGAGRGCDPVVMLTFGTGVGGAAMIGQRILRGANGEHPEMGHVPIADDGPACYCGTKGCLESYVSGTAIAAAGASEGMGGAAGVFAAAARGDAGALRIMEKALAAASTAAWLFFHALLPQRLILGGGLMDRHYGQFSTAMNRRMKMATQFAHSESAIVRAALGSDAGLVGAARLCTQTAEL